MYNTMISEKSSAMDLKDLLSVVRGIGRTSSDGDTISYFDTGHDVYVVDRKDVAADISRDVSVFVYDGHELLGKANLSLIHTDSVLKSPGFINSLKGTTIKNGLKFALSEIFSDFPVDEFFNGNASVHELSKYLCSDEDDGTWILLLKKMRMKEVKGMVPFDVLNSVSDALEARYCALGTFMAFGTPLVNTRDASLRKSLVNTLTDRGYLSKNKAVGGPLTSYIPV